MQLYCLDMSLACYRREVNRYRLLAADADRQQAKQFRRKAAECEDLVGDLDKARSSDFGTDTSNRLYLAWPLLRGASR